MKTKLTLSILASSMFLSSCGSIINGSSQDINISSSPSGAAITVDGAYTGVTPATVQLKRSNNHTVTIQMAGYQPYSVNVKKSISGWYWGNILFGGIIGLVIDPCTGGMYSLSPEQIQAQLSGGKHVVSSSNGDQPVMLFVSMEIDPTWKEVGRLKKS